MTYLVQIDDEVREATADEIAIIEEAAAKDAEKEADAIAKLKAKAALLERLGITEDEAKLLLA